MELQPQRVDGCWAVAGKAGLPHGCPSLRLCQPQCEGAPVMGAGVASHVPMTHGASVFSHFGRPS